VEWELGVVQISLDGTLLAVSSQVSKKKKEEISH